MAMFLTEEEVIKQFFPAAEIVRISLELSDSTILTEREPHVSIVRPGKEKREGNLIVTIDFVLKEKLRNEGIGALADASEFRKYLFFKIMQGVGRGSDIRLSASEVVEQIVPLESKKSFRIFRKVDSDGAVNYDYFHSVKFQIRGENPDFLSYTFIPFINKEKFNEDFNVSLEKDEGKPFTVVVIDKRKGDRVRDYRVQDYRHVETSVRVLNLSLADKALDAPIMKFDRSNDTTAGRKPSNYFSNVHISRDLEENARYVFALDYKKFLTEKSVFGSYYEDAPFGSFYRTFRVRKMNILRRRVRVKEGVNRVLSETAVVMPFSDYEEEKVIVSTKEEGPRKIRTVVESENFVGTIKEVAVHTLETEDNVRFFTGIDREVKNFTHGKYQYGVEIQIEDLTRERFINYRNALVKSKVILQEYLEEASLLGRKTHFEEIDSPYIKDDREVGKSQEKLQGNYDPITNTFTPKFVRGQMKKYSDSGQRMIRFGRRISSPVSMVEAPWVSVPFNYIKILKLLSEISKSELNNLRQFLVTIIHPATGSPKGIQTAISMIDDLTDKVGSIVGLYKEPSLGDSGNSWAGGASLKKDLSLKKWFTNEIFNASLEKGVGLDYFSLDPYEGEKNYDGLRLISGKDYRNRVEQETEKYFTSPEEDLTVATEVRPGIARAVDSTATTMYAYLSPAVVRMRNRGNVSTAKMKTASKQSQEQAVEAEASSAKQKTAANKTTTQDTTEQESYTRVLNTTAATIGVTIETEETQTQPLTEKERVATTEPVASTTAERPATQKQRGENVVIDKVEEQKTSKSEEKASTQNTNYAMHHLTVSVNAFATPAEGKESGEQEDADKKYDTGTKNLTVKVSTGNAATETKIDSMANFNLTDKEGVLHAGAKDESIVKSIMAGTTKKNSSQTAPEAPVPEIEEVIRLLPNQIKALIMESENPSILHETWADKDPLADPTSPNASIFRYNYMLLESVEVLAGYDEAGTEKQIKLERWVPLTAEIYNGNVGKVLLCRLEDYQNKHLGIVRDKKLSLPVYNEYFFISPRDEIGIEVIPEPVPLPAPPIPALPELPPIPTLPEPVIPEFPPLPEIAPVGVAVSTLQIQQVQLEEEAEEPESKLKRQLAATFAPQEEQVSFVATTGVAQAFVNGLSAEVEEEEESPEPFVQNRIVKPDSEEVTMEEIVDNSRKEAQNAVKNAQTSESVSYEQNSKEDAEEIAMVMQESTYVAASNQARVEAEEQPRQTQERRGRGK